MNFIHHNHCFCVKLYFSPPLYFASNRKIYKYFSVDWIVDYRESWLIFDFICTSHLSLWQYFAFLRKLTVIVDYIYGKVCSTHCVLIHGLAGVVVHTEFTSHRCMLFCIFFIVSFDFQLHHTENSFFFKFNVFFVNLCESLWIFANICESLQIFVNLCEFCESLRILWIV